MAHLDLTFTARQDGTGPDDGMRLGELEEALHAARTAGATSATRVHASVSQNRRVRQLRVEVRADDRPRDEHGRFAAEEDPPPLPLTGDAGQEPRLGPRRVRDAPQA